MRYLIKNKYLILFLLITIFEISSFAQKNYYFSGSDELIANHLNEIKNKNIALVTNRTAVLVNGVHLIDTLLAIEYIYLKKIFSPEHGFQINVEAGGFVSNERISQKNIPIISLYGKNKKPAKEDLNGIEIVLFDIQDLGVRFYTYISTLYYVLESAAENGVEVFILDRPDPLNGNIVEGPVLKKNELSFIGIQPLPILYGMTTGELAYYFNDRIDKKIGKKAKLKVIKLKNWKRDSFLSDYSNEWTSTSPNIPDFETALVYPGTALLEGTNVSEGRGTYSPFLKIGAPFIDAEELSAAVNKAEIPGARVSPVSFTPESIKGMSENPKYLGVKCNGISIEVTEPGKFNSVRFGILLIKTIQKLYPNDIKFNKHFLKLIGKSFYDKCFNLQNNCDYEKDLNKFKKIRKKYLIYN